MSALVRVGSLSIGTAFRTGAGRRRGRVVGHSLVTLEGDDVERAVEVQLLAPAQVKQLHPLVLVEVVH